jgi:hypothetical protein
MDTASTAIAEFCDITAMNAKAVDRGIDPAAPMAQGATKFTALRA